jgi:plastocyanin
MRAFVLPASLLAGIALFAACSSDGPTENPNIVRFVAIQGADTMDVTAYGQLQLSAFGLNANRVEVPPHTFSFTWRSLDPGVATVISGGFVSVTQNGIARIIAQIGAAADTVVLRVQQTATRITFDQDTAVALMDGATRLSGDALPNDTLTINAFRSDANGNPMSTAGGGSIVWSSGSPLLTIVPIAGTDSAKIIGTAPGSGTITASIGGLASATLPFFVVDQYAVVRMFKANFPNQTTQLTPPTVTIPAGAAVVFRSADQDVHAAVSTTAQWETAPLQGPSGREAQRFTIPGSHSYRVENTAGTVVVQ